MANYLIIRRSPNWRSYDLAETASFLRGLNTLGALNLNRPWPEDLITSFAAMWDDAMALTFSEFRARAREVTMDCALHTGARLLFVDQWLEDGEYASLTNILKPNDNIVFTDDDDWMSPETFRHVETSNGLVSFWNFIFTGHIESREHDLPVVGTNILKRPATDHLFTNNHAIKGELLSLVGLKICMEHYSMQKVFEDVRSETRHIDRYLSAANRGLCSSTTIQLNQSIISSPPDVRALAYRYQASIEDIVTDSDTDWIQPYLKQIQGLLHEALRA